MKGPSANVTSDSLTLSKVSAGYSNDQRVGRKEKHRKETDFVPRKENIHQDENESVGCIPARMTRVTGSPAQATR